MYKEINIYKYFKFFVKENYQGRNNSDGYPAHYFKIKNPLSCSGGCVTTLHCHCERPEGSAAIFLFLSQHGIASVVSLLRNNIKGSSKNVISAKPGIHNVFKSLNSRLGGSDRM